MGGVGIRPRVGRRVVFSRARCVTIVTLAFFARCVPGFARRTAEERDQSLGGHGHAQKLEHARREGMEEIKLPRSHGTDEAHGLVGREIDDRQGVAYDPDFAETVLDDDPVPVGDVLHAVDFPAVPAPYGMDSDRAADADDGQR